ncbi:AI-2E family transporter [Agromyces sp. GXS1127]|uniref:AI-2E family transporter n=1 Tax=Agromyces sp. GXS1127 TaxID=3424181 RepID=UPI003D31CB62
MSAPGPADEADRTGGTAPGRPHRAAFILVGLGGAVVVAFGISSLRPVFAATMLAVVLTICSHPLRKKLEELRVPRGAATGLVVLSLVVLLGAFWYGLILAVGQFAGLLPQYASEFQSWLVGLAEWLVGIGFGPEQAAFLVDAIDPARLFDVVVTAVSGATGIVTSTFVLITMLIAMGVDAAWTDPVLVSIRRRRGELIEALGSAVVGIRRYVSVTLVLGAVQGLLNWLALSLLGIPGAALWGLLSFLCSFIPNFGYFIAIIPPLILGGLIGGWPMIAWVIVIYGLINAVIQSIVQPRIVGQTVNLSQTITLLSVLFWAAILGPMGALLAIPLTLLVRAALVEADPRWTWLRPALADRAGLGRRDDRDGKSPANAQD